MEDCADRSDERNCPMFHCTDGQDIVAHLRCDNVANCSDGSDESGCAAGISTQVANFICN